MNPSFPFDIEAVKVEKVLAQGNITAACPEMKTAGKMIECKLFLKLGKSIRCVEIDFKNNSTELIDLNEE